MNYLEQVAFMLLAGLAVGLFSWNALQIRRNILMGKHKDMSGNKRERWKNVLLLAFGQKKMFRNPLVAISTKR